MQMLGGIVFSNEGGEGQVQEEVDADKADDAMVFSVNRNGGGTDRLTVLIFSKIACVGGAVVRFYTLEHLKGKVCDGRADLSSGIVPVHDADHALVGISKGLYHNFIAGAEIFRQSLCQIGV